MAGRGPVVDPALVARLRAAGCVFAEDEARLLTTAARGAARERLVGRRLAGEPLEYVLGRAEFAGYTVRVRLGVFVPRQRSLHLVRAGRRLLAGRPADAPPAVVVDLCCGSGALGLAVVADTPARLTATDLDPAAVACARANLRAVGGRVYKGDLYAALPRTLRGRIDLLLVNAPYVPSGELALLPREAREHEHPIALDGGADGLSVQRRVAAEVVGWLAPGGTVLIETGRQQAARTRALLRTAGLSATVLHSHRLAATVVRARRPIP